MIKKKKLKKSCEIILEKLFYPVPVHWKLHFLQRNKLNKTLFFCLF